MLVIDEVQISILRHVSELVIEVQQLLPGDEAAFVVQDLLKLGARDDATLVRVGFDDVAVDLAPEALEARFEVVCELVLAELGNLGFGEDGEGVGLWPDLHQEVAVEGLLLARDPEVELRIGLGAAAVQLRGLLASVDWLHPRCVILLVLVAS